MWTSLALFAATAAALPKVNLDARNAVIYDLAKRQNIIGEMMGAILNPGMGRIADVKGAAPRRVELTPRAAQIAGSKTVKVRYGPYKVPSMNTLNILGEGGALWNYPDQFVEKPCETCVIVGMNAGLEYPDGTNANIDTGMWLHHMVLLTVGPDRKDATCGSNPMSLPHMVVGATSQVSERMFSSGNERTHAQMPDWGISNVGYHLKPADKFSFIVDLMNENKADKVVYMTLTYDYVEGEQPTFDDMRPIWFDAAQCLTSDVAAKKQTGRWQITAPKWVADFEGEILGAAGHLHNGGVNVTLWADDKLACVSKATYGATNEYKTMAGMEPEHPLDAFEHISNMSVCATSLGSLAVNRLVKGQTWVLKGDYDYYKHRGMLNHKGKQDFVMGISIMYVRVPYKPYTPELPKAFLDALKTGPKTLEDYKKGLRPETTAAAPAATQ